MIEPSSKLLVDAVITTLQEHIAPLCADHPRAASEMRSVDVILRLVASRLEHEAAVIAEDNQDLRRLLGRLVAVGVDIPPWSDSSDPAAANLAMRGAVESALHVLHDGNHCDELVAVRAYMVTATRREQRVYGAISGRRAY